MHSLLTWNVRNPSPARAANQCEWLRELDQDVIVLTEIKPNSPGGLTIHKKLSQSGFQILLPDCGKHAYGVLIATKIPNVMTPLPLASNLEGGRTVIASVTTGPLKGIRIGGFYVPSRGPRSRRNVEKRQYQSNVATMLENLIMPQPENWILAGDFNVVCRTDLPRHGVFGKWEYDFFESFRDAGLIDAHFLGGRRTNEHTWFGRSGLGYRFDHIFVAANLASRVRSSEILHEPRKSGLSDHSACMIALL